MELSDGWLRTPSKILIADPRRRKYAFSYRWHDTLSHDINSSLAHRWNATFDTFFFTDLESNPLQSFHNIFILQKPIKRSQGQRACSTAQWVLGVAELSLAVVVQLADDVLGVLGRFTEEGVERR